MIKTLQNFRNVKLNGDPGKNMATVLKLLADFENYVCKNITPPAVADDATYIPANEKGAANGVAILGPDGRVPTSELPVSGNLAAEVQARADGDADLQTQVDDLDAQKQDLIVKGSAVLEADGTVTVPCTSVKADSIIFLSPTSGNSNMTIKHQNIVANTSFDIVSAGGADDSGLTINWLILQV